MKRIFLIPAVILSLLAGGIAVGQSDPAVVKVDPQLIFLLKKGDEKLTAKDYPGAMTYFTDARDLAPKDPRPLYRIALTALQLKQGQAGLDAIEKLGALQPEAVKNKDIVELKTALALAASKINPPLGTTGGSAQDARERQRRVKEDIAVASLVERLREAIITIDPANNTEARTNLMNKIEMDLGQLIADPDQNNIRVWELAGAFALAENGGHLNAFASEAIQRLNPAFNENPQSVALIGKLSKIGSFYTNNDITKSRDKTRKLLVQAMTGDRAITKSSG